MITTVLFDLDGLLADSEPLHRQAYQEVLAQYGVTITDADYIEHWIRTGKGIADWVREYLLDLDPNLLRYQKANRYRELVSSSLRPMDGAVAVLERLRGHKQLALASSSGRDAVASVTAQLGIAPYFEVIVSGTDVERSKPAPDIFLYTAQQLKVLPARCVVVEDAEKGVVAARQAGMLCVAVPNQYTQQNDFSAASCVLSSLRELTLELLDTLRDRKP